jgi:two-component system cell cycle response regulator
MAQSMLLGERREQQQAARGPDKPYRIMVVEDDLAMRMLIEQQVADLGYEAVGAEDGAGAFEHLRAEPGLADVVIADKRMPVMDGLALVKRLKALPETRRIPVIMLTGDNQPDEVKAGIDAGVFYYLTKPVSSPILASVLTAALRDVAQKRALATELKHHRAGFDKIDVCRFRLQTPDEARSVASLMASCFQDPEKALLGIYELLINAVEHGNLEIGYEGKAELLQSGTLQHEISKRLHMPAYRDRFVEATLHKKDEGTYAIIQDAGKGFPWREFLQVDSARATHLNGRGIAKANHLSFDKLSFNEEGNRAVGFMSHSVELEW